MNLLTKILRRKLLNRLLYKEDSKKQEQFLKSILLSSSDLTDHILYAISNKWIS